MAGESIQAGDRVQLKSGGPVMTVSDVENQGVWCQWFDNHQTLQSGSFNIHMLIKVRDRGE
jgi:uncharacterized protein YodC (DUF2158 family)